jgi:hypothetical protein
MTFPARYAPLAVPAIPEVTNAPWRLADYALARACPA